MEYVVPTGSMGRIIPQLTREKTGMSGEKGHISKKKFSYTEHFLQWLWKEGLFNQSELKTECGQPVKIIDPGRLNATDGPDFQHASVYIGNICFHGSIEIHTTSKNWFRHGHHHDPNYSSVILHVVMDPSPMTTLNAEGTSIPITDLSPHISPELNSFYQEFNTEHSLPCMRGLSFISEEVFLQQIEKAHTEYLEKKVNDFLRFYDPTLVPSKAWYSALILSLFDGLGITHNREQMQEVGKKYLSKRKVHGSTHEKEMLNWVRSDEGRSHLSWHLKGVRSNHHPHKRIQEAVRISNVLLSYRLSHFLKVSGFPIWENAIHKTGLSMTAHYKLLKATVFLPAMYVLGNLFGATYISEEARRQWSRFVAPIPRSLVKKVQVFSPEANRKISTKLGTIHQLRSYCNNKQCYNCEVLKKAVIGSSPKTQKIGILP